MEVKPKQKAKQIIKELDFSGDGCAVSLVGPSVGGAANNYKILTMKSASKISEDFIKKASTVKVTMEITEFLSTFYGLYSTESETLARALGFTTAMQDEVEASSPEEYTDWYENYIDTRVQSIEVMKSLYQAENMADVLADLDGPSYLKLVQDQQMLEKSFRKIERSSKAKESKPAGKDTSETITEVKDGVSPVVKQTNKENKMDEIVELQKSLDSQKEMLTKALEQIKAFEAEKKEAIAKSRKAEVLAAVKDEDKVEVLFKAVADASDEDFKAVVKALKGLTDAVDKSILFVEKGVQLDNHEGQPVESAVVKAAKARIAKAAK